MYDDSYYIVKSKTDTVNSFVFTKEAQENFLSDLFTCVQRYLHDYNTQSSLLPLKREIQMTLFKHILEANVINSFLTLSQYENVLFIPSFKDSRHTSYFITYNPPMPTTSNICVHLTPVINKYFQSSPNIYVAYPDSHVSLYKYIMGEYGVNIVSSNKMYTLGDESYSITPPEDVKFDAVYLAGLDGSEDGSFNASELKEDFSQYCTEDFDLIDDFVDDYKKLEFLEVGGNINFENENRITGESKVRSDISSYISTHFIPKSLVEDSTDFDYASVSAIVAKGIDEGLKIY